ncbi:MAG: SPOR domain-containing protein [Erythrobacter sp.]
MALFKITAHNPVRIIAQALAGGIICAAAAMPATADVKAGVDAWAEGDFQRAVAEWQEPAQNGDADAIFNLAQAYRLGRGVEGDNARARTLYAEAAAMGHTKAADNYGLLLFQEGEQERAMPLVQSAADRGDPRAQYIIGLSHFNGDYAPRDWVRAYALMTLAQGAGLPQARGALAQMDQYIPLPQRQQAQVVARELEEDANRRRAAELAAVELASRPLGAAPQSAALAAPAAARSALLPTPAGLAALVPAQPASPRPAQPVAPAPAPVAAPALVRSEPASPPVAARPAPVAALAAASTAPAPTSAPAPTPARAAGSWRVQLGAFAVADNAERMWRQLAGNPALAGTRKATIGSGKITRLHAVGFATKSDAEQACAALKRQGQGCLVAGNS